MLLKGTAVTSSNSAFSSMLCVSPKAGTRIDLRSGTDLKFVFPPNADATGRIREFGFPALLLQPMDGPELERNTRLAVEYCLAHPEWRLSIQMHKMLGIR
jgi:organic radical activating enzyme